MSFFYGPIRKISLVLIFGAAFLLLSSFLPTYGHSAQVTLAWDANTEGDIAGYKIYYGTSSRAYTVGVDVGNRLTCTVPGLQDTLTYYFAATAYDTSGLESAFSAEVVSTPPPPPSCAYSILPSSQSFSASAGPGQVYVTTTSACAWTAVSNVPWIVITSNSSSTGSSTVNYSVLENTGTTSRTGTLTIAGNTFAVTQSGITCSYSISSISEAFGSSGGTGTVTVSAADGCSWSASSGASWITITSGNSGSGNGTTGYTVDANPGSSSRTGVLTVASQTLTVTQSGSSSGGVVFAMNCGGSQYTDKTGVIYQADGYNQGGSTSRTTAGIAGTEDDPLYQSERYGNFSYAIPLTNGNYSVKLRFAEIYWSSAGRRIFDVWMEGKKVISSLDIFALVGKNTAYDVSIPATVTDGKLDIKFQATADYGKVSAIVITEDPLPRSVVFALNSGSSSAYTDAKGVVYEADQYYNGGWTSSTTADIEGTEDIPLYQSGRTGDFSYSIPLANGSYEVLLKFAEVRWSSPGGRVMDIWMEGTKVISSLDIFAIVGQNRAYDVSIPVTVSDGSLDIDFQSIAGSAKVNAIVITQSPSARSVVFALNSGSSSAYTDAKGVVYEADQYYNGGWTSSTTADIEGTEDVPLYQSGRYGDFSYSIPLPNGSYEVLLKFAEVRWSSPGGRVMDIWMEGTKVISSLDIFAIAGQNRAYDVSIPVTVSDGSLDIDFESIAGNAKVNAIVVTTM